MKWDHDHLFAVITHHDFVGGTHGGDELSFQFWLAIVRETLVIVNVIHTHINQLNLLPPGGSNKFLRNHFFYIILAPTSFLAIFFGYTYIFPWFNFWVQILYIQVPTKLFSGNLYYLFVISTFSLKWKNLQNGLSDLHEIWYTHGCTFKLVI